MKKPYLMFEDDNFSYFDVPDGCYILAGDKDGKPICVYKDVPFTLKVGKRKWAKVTITGN